MAVINPQHLRGKLIALFRRGDGRTFIRYTVVGAAQNAFFYGLTLFLLSLKFAAWQAIIFLYPLAVAISFVANRSWSFDDRAGSTKQFRNYVLVYVAVYPAAILFTWLQERAGVQSWLAGLITMAVFAVGMFFALNFWVFRKDTGDKFDAVNSA